MATEQQQIDLLIHSATLWSAGSTLADSAIAVDGGKIVALGGPELAGQYDARQTVDAT